MDRYSVRAKVNGNDEWFTVEAPVLRRESAVALANVYFRQLMATRAEIVEVTNMTSDVDKSW